MVFEKGSSARLFLVCLFAAALLHLELKELVLCEELFRILKPQKRKAQMATLQKCIPVSQTHRATVGLYRYLELV